MTDAIATATETAATPVDADAAYGAVYDRMMAEGADDAHDPAPDTPATAPSDRDDKGRFKSKASEVQAAPPEQPGETKDKTPGVSDRAPASLPANLPPDMAADWEAIPEASRGKFSKVLNDLHTKMSDLGRQTSAYRELKPVLDDMQASYAQHFQNGMKPADAMQYLLTVQKDMDRSPVETLLRIGKHYNVIPQLAQQLGISGQPNEGAAEIASLKSVIQGLEGRLASIMSPENFNSQITRAMSERDVEQAVERFATEKPFYADVEPYLAQFIAIAREQAPDANRLDWLQTAYDMAVNALPATREKAQAAAVKAAAPKPDPRAAAAKQAASINVTSTASGKTRPRSEEEAMGEVWDRHFRN